jgi:hypothetical protein
MRMRGAPCPPSLALTRAARALSPQVERDEPAVLLAALERARARVVSAAPVSRAAALRGSSARRRRRPHLPRLGRAARARLRPRLPLRAALVPAGHAGAGERAIERERERARPPQGRASLARLLARTRSHVGHTPLPSRSPQLPLIALSQAPALAMRGRRRGNLVVWASLLAGQPLLLLLYFREWAQRSAANEDFFCLTPSVPPQAPAPLALAQA